MSKSVQKIKTAYFLGNYSECISLASELDSSKEQESIRAYEYLSRINLAETDFVKEELADTKVPLLQAIYWLNEYYMMEDTESFEEVKKECISKFENWMVDPELEKNSQFLCICSRFFADAGDFKKAVQSVWKKEKSLEMFYTLIVLLLKHERLDIAAKVLKKMKSKDDLSIITQLTEVFFNLKAGGDQRVDDALTTLQHFIEKYGESLVLLNARASGLMLQKNFSIAEKVLLKALGKKSNDINTISNLIICQKNLKKSEKVIQRYEKQLEKLNGKKISIIDKISQKFDEELKALA